MHRLRLHPQISILSKKLKDKNFLASIKTLLEELLKDQVTIGSEIEFYLLGISLEELARQLPIYNFIKERGNGQIEYHILPFSNYEASVKKIDKTIEEVTLVVKSLGGKAIFHPKPYIDDYGNALQIQISSPSSLFQEKIDDICASFCHYAASTFLAYAPHDEDYNRFVEGFMAPTHISYGNNNRTCLIRINGSNQKRIEIRAPSPLCEPYTMISTALLTLFKALKEPSKAEIFPKIFGNSYDAQYNLPKLSSNIKDAASQFNENFFSDI